MGSSGGTNNSSFNRRKKGIAKVKKEKIRVVRKAKGKLQKHKASIVAVSGKRTSKHQKRIEHRERMNEQSAQGAEQDVQMQGAPKQAKRAKQPKAKKQPADAGTAPAPMQE